MQIKLLVSIRILKQFINKCVKRLFKTRFSGSKMAYKCQVVRLTAFAEFCDKQ